jgi:hypothetical protein
MTTLMTPYDAAAAAAGGGGVGGGCRSRMSQFKLAMTARQTHKHDVTALLQRTAAWLR